jgi:hypothetical protein
METELSNSFQIKPSQLHELKQLTRLLGHQNNAGSIQAAMQSSKFQ